MRELLATLAGWQAAGTTFGLATVVATSASAPKPPGAAVAVHPDGTVLGSVSGGCVESAVVEACHEVLAGGPARLVTYGYSDETAFAVGLTCGGIIEVFVQAVPPVAEGGLDLAALADAVADDRPVAVATVVDAHDTALGREVVLRGDDVVGSLGNDGLDVAAVDDARGMLAAGATGRRHYGPRGERRMDTVGVFVHSFAPRPRMLVYGAIDHASAVTRIGRFLGYRVTVCDAREVFATSSRFPDADEIVVEWPHRHLVDAQVDERTVICVLTHDPKFDVPVLREALASPAGYVGVMGSRRTHDERVERLRAEGVPEEQLARLRSPIGLDLGGRTPEETAVSIAAEIVASRWHGTGRPLRELDGRVHHDLPDDPHLTDLPTTPTPATGP